MQSKFTFFQNQLGNEAQLGLKWFLLDPQGQVIKEDGYNDIVKLPMASVKKVAIALCALQKVFVDETRSIDDKLKIQNDKFSPGPPWNVLDRYFFMPWNTEQNMSIKELTTLMLRDSDNTATDLLIDYVGGIDAVNQFIKSLGINGFNLTANSKKLLSDYYKFSGEKNFSGISHVLYEFATAFSVRATEKSMILHEEDSCSPNCMSELLKLIVIESVKNQQTWLSKAAKIINETMQLSLTGTELIRAGAEKFPGQVTQIGDKTGWFGGIENNCAFMQFSNGNWLILSVFSCLASISLKSRHKVIADIAQNIIEQNKEYLIESNDVYIQFN